MKETAKMPVEIRAILSDLAQIRMEILSNAPQCLPAIAPAMIDAEQRINSFWRA